MFSILMIMNTDRDNKKSAHWWSLLEFYTCGNNFLLDSFGFTGFKELVYGLKKFNKKDNKITLASLNFSSEADENLSRLKSKLATTA